jgi:5'-nucleotidase
MAKPLILLTNDDGIHSPGLLAAAQALDPLGELLIAAPLHQHSGVGRGFSRASTGAIERTPIESARGRLEAYAIDGTPAQTVVHALTELAPRRPDLAVIGINYGENVGSDITGSGTVGAAIEAAASHIPALAVSLQTETEYHFSHSNDIDFGVAAHWTRRLAERLLAPGVALPPDVDLLKVDVPQGATRDTPWRVTRVSRQRYFEAVVEPRADLADAQPLGYQARSEWAELEPDSDIYALVHDRVISIAPVSIDLSARTSRDQIQKLLTDADGPQGTS